MTMHITTMTVSCDPQWTVYTVNVSELSIPPLPDVALQNCEALAQLSGGEKGVLRVF